MTWLPGHQEREMDEEIRFHLEMEAEKNRLRGMSESEARKAATRAFGGVRRVKEEIRDLRRTRPVEMFFHDVAYGWRTLRNAPAYALTTIFTIGIAAGICAAVATFIEASLLRPLPHRAPDRVVTIWETNRSSGETQLPVSPANFLDWQARVKSFESMGMSAPHGVDIRRGDRMVSVSAGRVSSDYFRTLGISPIAGTLFNDADFATGAQPRVVLSEKFWIDAFGGDRAVVGRPIEIDGRPVTILGVVPEGADHAEHFDVYIPLFLHRGEKTNRTGHWMYATGRLRDGVTIEEAARDLDRAAGMIASESPHTNEALRTRVIPLTEAVLGKTRRLLAAVGGASICLFLLACANIAALALARGAARRRELAIRVSLGAGRGRIVSQLATESAMLNSAAAVVALAVALFVVRWMSSNAPDGLRRLDDVRAGTFTLLAIGLTAVLSTLLSGVLPALRFARAGHATSLETSRRDSDVSRGESRLQASLVVVQIALALLLLTGAGLLTRSLQKLTANDLGFDPHGVATLQMYLFDLHPKLEERVQFVRTSLDSIRALPGVTSAAATSALPFAPAMDARDEFEIAGRARRSGESLTINTTAISPQYFTTMKIRVVAGRDFAETDDARSQRVAIINESAARRFWNESPLGSKMTFGFMGPPFEWTVVGVVADTRASDYGQPARPEVFIPIAQAGARVGGVTYVARASRADTTVVEAMQNKIWELTPSQSITEAAPMTSLLARSLQTQRFALLMIAGFGGVALLLSTTGLFGLLSYIAVRRRPEVGVRMALGATPRTIKKLFVGRGLALATFGVAAGLLLSISFSRLLESFLYETSAFDAVTLIAVAASTIAVAFVASWIPAHRVAALDPSSILRSET